MSPAGYISLEDVLSELKDWFIILVPIVVANQDIVSSFFQTYLHIPASVIVVVGGFCYFLYQRLKAGEPIGVKEVAQEVVDLSTPHDNTVTPQ